MDTAKDTPAEQHRMEKEDIEDLGTVTLSRGGHVIHCLTVIGQIEGHTEAPQGQKTTKYEHVIPQLVAVQEDPRIEGLLVDRKSTRLNSRHRLESRMPSSA